MSYFFVVLILVCITLYLVFPQVLFRGMIAVGRALSGLKRKTVQVNGETWHYLEGGPEGATPLVLLHGFGADKDIWLGYAKRFAKEYRVIIPDLPGYGDSAQHEHWDYRIDAQVGRLHDFLLTLSVNRFHLAGNSMGGMIAGRYALAYPEELHSLALIANAGIDSPNKTEFYQALEKETRKLVAKSRAEFDEMMQLIVHKAPWMPGAFKRVLCDDAIRRSSFLEKVFDAIKKDVEQNHLTPQLAEIQIPTLILWGRQDRILDVSSVEVMEKLIPNNRTVILEETGHVPMFERPVDTARHHLNFMKI